MPPLPPAPAPRTTYAPTRTGVPLSYTHGRLGAAGAAAAGAALTAVDAAAHSLVPVTPAAYLPPADDDDDADDAATVSAVAGGLAVGVVVGAFRSGLVEVWRRAPSGGAAGAAGRCDAPALPPAAVRRALGRLPTLGSDGAGGGDGGGPDGNGGDDGDGDDADDVVEEAGVPRSDWTLTRRWRPLENGVVNAVSLDASASLLLLAFPTGAVRVWDLTTHHPTHVFQVAAAAATPVTVASFVYPSGGAEGGELPVAVVGTAGGAVVVLDLITRRSRVLSTGSRGAAAAANGGGEAGGGGDGGGGGGGGHVAAVSGVATAGGGRFATVGADGLMCVWDIAGGAVVVATAGERLAAVVAARPGLLLTGGEGGVVRAWAVGAKGGARELHAAATTLPRAGAAGAAGAAGDAVPPPDEDDAVDHAVVDMVLLPGGSELLVAMADQTLVFVDVTAAAGAAAPALAVGTVLTGNLDEIYDVRVLDGGHGDVVVASNSPAVRVFSPPSAAADLTSPSATGVWRVSGLLVGHTGIVLAVDAAPGWVASAGRDRTARLWRQPVAAAGAAAAPSAAPVAWECVATAAGHTDTVGAVVLSRPLTKAAAAAAASAAGPAAAGAPPAGSYLVTAAADRTLKRWNLRGVGKRAAAAAKGGGGTPARPGSDTPAKLTAAWTVVAHAGDINAVAVSPDNATLATASADRSAKLWAASSGALVATCVGHKRGVFAVAFSPVDRVLATAGADATVRLWSASSGAPLRTLEGHTGPALRVSWATAGSQLLSSDAGGGLRLWAARLGVGVSAWDAAAGAAWALGTVADGAAVVSGGVDGALRVWADVSAAVAAAAAARADAVTSAVAGVEAAARRRQWGRAARGAVEVELPRKLKAVVLDLLAVCAAAGDEGGSLCGTAAAEMDALVRAVLGPLPPRPPPASLFPPTAGDGGDSDGILDGVDPAVAAMAADAAADAADAGALPPRAGRRLASLLAAAREWAAGGGPPSAAAAAAVLAAVLRVLPAGALAAGVPGGRALAEGLAAHGGRHAARLRRVGLGLAFVDYTLDAARAGGGGGGGRPRQRRAPRR
ncbi:hypothetical protein I4F81_008588 [Pyropia yezoensis]|uniref:Uncharacterized protein n=1 Tax=Pyropia yezoensis TaxID=2788 RepID=A0ACC3C863_PYRYE|nr:hypothetical protein I4F81_008588 [Neopyropia yezoensis]